MITDGVRHIPIPKGVYNFLLPVLGPERHLNGSTTECYLWSKDSVYGTTYYFVGTIPEYREEMRRCLYMEDSEKYID